MSSMHLSDLLTNIHNGLAELKASGKTDSDFVFQRALINAALFIAALSSINERRNRAHPDGYEQRPGYVKYKAQVSGPCHRMLLILAGDPTDNLIEGKVSSIDYQTLAIKVRSIYLDGKLAKGTLDDYKDKNGKPDYSEVYRDILKMKTEKSLINKLSYQLIRDCCIDLEIRNDTNRQKEKNAAIEKYQRKIGIDPRNNERDDANEQKFTNISFAISSVTCRATIIELNNAYKNSENEDERHRFEHIFIPVYSYSPYFFLCITHRNNLPKEIVANCSMDQHFVFAITTAEYILDQFNENKGAYSVTYNVISNDYIKTLSDLPLDILEDLEEERIKKGNGINNRFYTNYKNKGCCAMSYNDMIERYKVCCDYFEGYSPRRYKEDHWLPVDLPKGITERISHLYKNEGPGMFNLEHFFEESHKIIDIDPALLAYTERSERTLHSDYIERKQK